MNPAAAPSPIMSLVPIAAIFLIFYFLIIRPQQKQQKEHEKMLENLKKGDRVITNGGIHGTITGFKDGHIEVQIAQNVKVTVSRSGIQKLHAESGVPAANGAPVAS